mgnify:FL=1
MAELVKRPKLLGADTDEAEVLGLIVEGVCSRRKDFDGFCEIEGEPLKRVLSRLSQKEFIYYIKKHRSWRPTDAGTDAYDTMHALDRPVVVKDIVGDMFTAMVAVQMGHKDPVFKHNVGEAIIRLQQVISLAKKTTKHCDKEWEFSA